MAHKGFLGHRIGLGTIVISGSVLQVDVQFVDEDSRVHATTTHKIGLESEGDPIPAAVDDLTKLLEEHISRLHFNEPDGTEKEEVANGIAEALRQASSDTTDGFEEGG